MFVNGYGQEVPWWECALGLGLPVLMVFLLVVYFLPRFMRSDLYEDKRKKGKKNR